MEGPESIPALPTPSFKKRAVKGKSTARRRPISPLSSKNADFDLSSSEDEDGRQVKRARKTVGVTARSTVLESHSEVSVQAGITPILPPNSSDATKSSNWFDEPDGHAKSNQDRSAGRAGPGRTHNAPQNALTKIGDKPLIQVGPVKSSTNVRTITVIDFAPDVCKDYKQTGFCGFGDSCKFLHAREDYKQGWELDRDWEIGIKGKRIQNRTVASANRSTKNDNEIEDDDAFLESIPFACIICKKSYKDPIVTRCGHYFCEGCALQRYRKTPSCAACGAGTGGVFNVARRLNNLLDKKKERAKKRKDEARANGIESSGDEGQSEDDKDDDAA